MKRYLRVCAAVAAIALGLSGCAMLPDFAQHVQNAMQPDAPLADVPYIDPAIQTPFDVQQCTFYYNQLPSEEARIIYRAALYQFAENSTEPVYLKGDYEPSEVSAALRAVQYDYPQLLCAPWGQKCSYYTTSSGEALGIELYYSSPPTERVAARTALAEATSKILAEAAAYDDLFERELFLYETVILRTEYDYACAAASDSVTGDAVANLSLSDRMAHTAYGSLVGGQAVCDGYSGAFQLLCNYAGIESATIIGHANWDGMNSKARDNHAWNLVTLPSGSYYCDATWDDNGGARLDGNGRMVTGPDATADMRSVNMPVLHRYMNLSYEEMAQNHDFTGGYTYPQQCDASDNYFNRKGLTLNSPAALTEYANNLAAGQNWPQMLSFEVRLGFEPGNAGPVLSASFAGTGEYNYMFSSTPANRMNCYLICLYY